MIMATCIKTLISLACVGAVAYLAYRNRDKIRDLVKGQQNDGEQTTTDQQPNIDVTKVSFPKESFLANVSKFSGSFEPLYNAVNNPNTPTEEKESILQDWTLRFMAIPCRDEYQAWLKNIGCTDINQRLEKLLEEITKCGMLRDDKITFVVDSILAKNYIEWTGAELQDGDNVKVGSAAWTLKGVCIEKGIVSKIL